MKKIETSGFCNAMLEYLSKTSVILPINAWKDLIVRRAGKDFALVFDLRCEDQLTRGQIIGMSQSWRFRGQF